MEWKKTTALLLTMCFLTSCSPQESATIRESPAAAASPTAETTSTPTPTASTPEPSATPVPASAAPTEPVSTPTPTPQPQGNQNAVRVSMLKGPTGLGAAWLMEQAAQGKTKDTYDFTVLAEPTEAVAKLTNGEVDIAALPTNVASTLYHRLNGEVQMLALNTKGVLYILENGQTVDTMADLAGKTVYATGQGANPEYVLNYLLESNGLTPGEDVTVSWKPSDELTALMATGEADLCMLPIPAATSVLLQNQEVRKAVSLSEAWKESDAGGALVMGCLVVRTAFARENPETVDRFLDEYEDSIKFMQDTKNLDEAALLAERYQIVPKAAVAKAALPDANLIYEDGDDMQAEIQGYYQVLYAADPSSIGGSIPDSAFYYDD